MLFYLEVRFFLNVNGNIDASGEIYLKDNQSIKSILKFCGILTNCKVLGFKVQQKLMN